MSGLLFQENQTEVIAALEVASGLGITIAPVMGSFLYHIGGFSLPFLVFGFLFIFVAIFVKKIVPAKVDYPHRKVNVNLRNSEIVSSIQENERVTYLRLLGRAKIFFASFSTSLAYFSYSQ